MMNQTRSYARVLDSEVLKYLRMYYKQTSLTFNNFCSIHSISSKRSNLSKNFTTSGAKKMKEEGKPCADAMVLITNFLDARSKKNTSNLKK